MPGHFAQIGPVLGRLVRAGPALVHFAPAGPFFGDFAQVGSLPAHFLSPLGDAPLMVLVDQYPASEGQKATITAAI